MGGGGQALAQLLAGAFDPDADALSMVVVGLGVHETLALPFSIQGTLCRRE